MTSLSTWISAIASCTTIFSSGSPRSFIQSEPHQALVNSEMPWDFLNLAEVVGCATLLIKNLDELENATNLVHKTRKEINVVVLLETDLSNYTEADWKSYQTNFNIHILINKHSGIQELTKLSPYNEKGLAKHRKITVSYLIFPPYILSAGSYPIGLDADILDTISSRLNVTVHYRQAKTFNTLVTALVEGQADMCISQPGLTIGRVNAGLDYVFMILRNIMFAQRHPVPIDSFYTASQPFTNAVWTWTLVTVIALAMTFMVLNCWYNHNSMIKYGDISISYIPIISESVPLAWYGKRVKNPYFVIMFIWLLCGTLLSLAYESNLLANLVKVDLEKQPETFKGSVLTYLLQYSPKSVHRKVYQESFLKHGGYYPDVVMPQSVMDIILDGKAVTLVPDDSMAIYDHVFTMGTEVMITGLASYYYTLKLPIRTELNKAILRLRDNGIIQEMTRRTNWALSMSSRQKRREHQDDLTVIGMSHFLPMLLCLIIGIVISLGTFVSEQIATICHKRKFNIISTSSSETNSLNLSYWPKKE